ncbi:TIGR02453 family protein [Nocardioides flavescens]|uniref:TIGR02453 family protein n=1 Tax=Nocardioides flavescens TaxID=2691959 RepID=A0A6L7EQJ7_9ACTN|nr:TIGR02453 family protein [Nocardioides flavescens]
MPFTGIPVAALDFYDDLEMDNTRSFWEKHKHVYEGSVKAPMQALVDELAAEFGTAKLFRPYRDVRFAKDKTPYKTHQGAFVRVADATGWYVEVSPRGVRTGGGFYHAEPLRLAAVREAVAHERTGPEVERLVEDLRAQGFEIGGERLKTRPRGYPADHPRIDLLRHKAIVANRVVGFEPVIHTPELVDLVRADWRATRPLVEWATEHAAT